MTGLDSSVVVRLLIGEPADQADRARLFLDSLFENGEKASVSDLVISEVYFALQHHYKVPKKEAIAALRSFLESKEIVGTGAAPDVLMTKNLASAKPGFVDRLIHEGYRAAGGPMATFEKRSSKLENVCVI
jgi:predicted nucleic-acid-binding protein